MVRKWKCDIRQIIFVLMSKEFVPRHSVGTHRHSNVKESFCVCVCPNVCVKVWGYIWRPMHESGSQKLTSGVLLSHCLTDLSSPIRPGWLTSRPLGSSISSLSSTGKTSLHCYTWLLCGLWGFELWLRKIPYPIMTSGLHMHTHTHVYTHMNLCTHINTHTSLLCSKKTNIYIIGRVAQFCTLNYKV